MLLMQASVSSNSQTALAQGSLTSSVNSTVNSVANSAANSKTNIQTAFSFPDPVAIADRKTAQKKLIASFATSVITPLMRRKWLIALTTLLISLIVVFTYLLMQPANITINTVLLAGVLLGFFLGSVIAFVREWKNSLLLSRDELQQLIGYEVLGVIPEAKRGERFLTRDIAGKPYSRIAEAYRLTATLLLHGQDANQQSKVILLTSSNAGEGKSVSSSNLAYCLSDLGAKVLLLDADLRMPSIHTRLGVQNKPGLINYLLGTQELAEVTHAVPGMPGLFVITAGSALDFSPVNLLSRNRMVSLLNRAKKYFDHVIIDAPPVRGFADTLLLHSMADSTLVVTPEERSEIDSFRQNLQLLVQVKPSILGLLKVRARKDVVEKEYYREYSHGSFHGREGLKRLMGCNNKRKLNLGKRR